MTPRAHHSQRMTEIFLVFLRLGCMCFGGPVAHLAYFRDEFVQKRRWLDESAFAQCIALTQILPGPASSQTGMLIGLLRGGWPGSIAAWTGFTLPSAAAMTAFGLYATSGIADRPWLHGLLVAAVAIVAYALVMMRRTLVPDAAHMAMTLVTAAAAIAFWRPFVPVAAIAACAAAALMLPARTGAEARSIRLPVSRSGSIAAGTVFAVLAAGLPAVAARLQIPMLTLAARLFDVGSLVFGGGHVVLPLLQSQVVANGIAPAHAVIAGYAAAQAVPGPLFTLSSYVGAVAYSHSLGIAGAIVATFAIFAPSFLLIAAAGPSYAFLANDPRFSRALSGANASVVGLLSAAFVNPIWMNAVHTFTDAALAAAAFAALAFARAPNWLVVFACAAAGFILPH